MRSSGVVEHARGLGPRDHLCWSYDRPGQFIARAREFLAEGLALGYRVCYIGDDDLWDGASAVDGLPRECVEVRSVAEMYPPDSVIEPLVQVETYAVATEAALADGFTGFRLVAETTSLVRSPAQLEAFTRFEHLVDRYMARNPFSAMCGYRRAELGHRWVAELACLHPIVSRGTTPFRLHASARDDCVAALSGSLDLATRELFPDALRRANPPAYDGVLALDATRLEFIDHRHLLVLDEYGQCGAATVVLHLPAGELACLLDQMTAVLGLRHVRIERCGSRAPLG